jgi:hypothetical protein
MSELNALKTMNQNCGATILGRYLINEGQNGKMGVFNMKTSTLLKGNSNHTFTLTIPDNKGNEVAVCYKEKDLRDMVRNENIVPYQTVVSLMEKRIDERFQEYNKTHLTQDTTVSDSQSMVLPREGVML